MMFAVSVGNDIFVYLLLCAIIIVFGWRFLSFNLFYFAVVNLVLCGGCTACVIGGLFLMGNGEMGWIAGSILFCMGLIAMLGAMVALKVFYRPEERNTEESGDE